MGRLTEADAGRSVTERIRTVLMHDPSVTSVELVGSRSRGTENALSDWDLRIEADDLDELVTALPSLTEPLQPLASQWDRLSDRAVYMLILPGAIKVDLFPGDRMRPTAGPWQPAASSLAAIDAHFWDWILWLGSKALHGQRAVVDEELDKLSINLLGPLGAHGVPGSVLDAIERYLQLRTSWPRAYGVMIDPGLGEAVLSRLHDVGLRL